MNPKATSLPQEDYAKGIHSPQPFLVLCRGFHALIFQATHKGDNCGLSICRSGPRVSHLFFADDFLIFCRALRGDGQKIQEILSIYEAASGQQVNRNKTTLFLASLPLVPSRKRRRKCWYSLSSVNKKNILAYHPSLGEKSGYA